jgi:hypothetical protein
MVIGHKIQGSSLDAYHEVKEEGDFILEQEKILRLIEEFPDLTKNQLLSIAIKRRIHNCRDSNWIAPKVNALMKKGLIVRPNNIPCPENGYLNFTHRIIPMKWSLQRALLLSSGIPASKLILDRMETPSKTDSSIRHTTIMWYDGSISCTCNEEYSRSEEFRCHHAKGMYEAKTGKRMGEEDWEGKYKALLEEHEKLKEDIAEFKRMYIK